MLFSLLKYSNFFELFGNLKTDWQLVPGPWVYVYKKKLDLKKKKADFLRIFDNPFEISYLQKGS